MTTTTSTTRQLFISYARADDIAFVEKLYHDLKRLGFEVWWDKNHMGNDGTPFTQQIGDAIRASERVLFVAGPRSFASPYCQGEWETALKLCIPVLPLLRVGVGGAPGDDYAAVIPARISSGHAVDCRPSRAYDDALNEIARVIGAPPAPPITPHGVPALPDAYIDRPLYLDPLKAAIRTGDPLIGITSKPDATALHGVGGIGKTTLAKALCLDCDVRRTFDQIFWVEAGPNASQASAPALMGGIGRLFNDAADLYQQLNTARAALTGHLTGKKTLIVLDDVWDGGLARDFLIAGVDCRVVVTTRVSHLLRGGAAVGVNNLDEGERLRLISEYLRVPVADLPPECARIAALVHGHTLAVSLAAAWLAQRGGVHDAPDLLARLTRKAEGDNPFKDLALNESDKNENLEVCLSLSYGDLPADLQRRFRALGILAPDGTFDTAAAGALWGDADDDDAREATDDALAALVRAGLAQRAEALTPDPQPDGEGKHTPRYSQHPLLRAYARALLRRQALTPRPPLPAGEGETAVEFEAAFARYADFVIGASAAFDELPMERWGELDPLLPHVAEVGDGLAARWADAAARNDDLTRRVGEFAYNITKYVFHRPQMIETAHGQEARGLRWLEMGLEVSQLQDDPRRTALFCNQIGLAWSALGEQRKALDFYEQALPLRRAVGDRRGEATTLNNIGLAWDALGEVRKALDFYEQALPLQRAVGDRGGEATTLNNIGGAWSALGEARKALDFYEQALPLRRAVGDRGGEATTLNNIGLAWDALGEKRKALDFYEQALPLQRAVGDRGGEATTLNNIGGAWSALGEKRKALDFYDRALPLQRAVGDRGGEATTLNNIGFAWDALGEKRKALDFYDSALPLFRAVGDREGEATTLNNMAVIHFQDGDFERAAAIFEQIIIVAREIGTVAWEALYLHNLAVVYQRLGRIDAAIESAEAGRALLVRYDLPQDAAGYKLAQYDAFLASLRGESPPSTPATLPAETVQQLAGSTIAVMTTAAAQRDDWRAALTGIRDDFGGRGADWGIEVAFADALLAVLDGESPSLPDANPYAGVVRQVVAALGGEGS